MCGIACLLLKDDSLQSRLGELMVPMVQAMEERGADSAGIAIFGPGEPAGLRFSLLAKPGVNWEDLAADLAGEVGADVTLGRRAGANGTIATLLCDSDPLVFSKALEAVVPSVALLGWGRSVEVLKATGAPSQMCEEYGIGNLAGHIGLAHTRMATESAVTAEHSHPFVPSQDLAIVHNGSFSNHATVRRRLEAEGIRLDTDNDSEVAARFLALRLGEGDSLDGAVRHLTVEMDGFFTLVVATADEISVVRDAFSCKPAVVAETEDYVAVASEYRALATLPGIELAKVFEPQPEEVYTWSR